jgi:hypothetical protein
MRLCVLAPDWVLARGLPLTCAMCLRERCADGKLDSRLALFSRRRAKGRRSRNPVRNFRDPFLRASRTAMCMRQHHDLKYMVTGYLSAGAPASIQPCFRNSPQLSLNPQTQRNSKIAHCAKFRPRQI